MEEKDKKRILIAILVLSSIGLLFSAYLLKLHFVPTEGVCDINNIVSCVLTNTSTYSELLDIPVAWFGIMWFLVSIVLSWKALQAEKVSVEGLFWWNIT